MSGELEISPSGRAICKICENTISAGVVRVYRMVPQRDHAAKHCYHLDCFEPKDELARALDGESFWGFIYRTLKEPHRETVDQWMVDWNVKVRKKESLLKEKFFLWKQIRDILYNDPTSDAPVIKRSNLPCPSLPKELLILICEFSSGETTGRLMLTNKTWYSWLEKSEDLWKGLCSRWLNTDNVILRNKNWRSQFRELFEFGCIDCGKPTDYFPLVGGSLCSDCRKKGEYRIITKSEAKRRFRVNETDLSFIMSLSQGCATYFLQGDVNWYMENREKLRKKIPAFFKNKRKESS